MATPYVNSYLIALRTPDGQTFYPDATGLSPLASSFVFHMDGACNRGYPAGSIFEFVVYAVALGIVAPTVPLQQTPCAFRNATTHCCFSVDEYVALDDNGQYIPHLDAVATYSATKVVSFPTIASATLSYAQPRTAALAYTGAHVLSAQGFGVGPIPDPGTGVGPTVVSFAPSGRPGSAMITFSNLLPSGPTTFTEAVEYQAAQDEFPIASMMLSASARRPCMPTLCQGNVPLNGYQALVFPLVGQSATGLDHELPGIVAQAELYLNGTPLGIDTQIGDYGNGYYLLWLTPQFTYQEGQLLVVVRPLQTTNNFVITTTNITVTITSQTGGIQPGVNFKPGPIQTHIGDWTTGVAMPIQVQMINNDGNRFSPSYGNFAYVNSWITRNGTVSYGTGQQPYEVPGSPGEYEIVLSAAEMSFIGTGRVLFVGINNLGQEVPHSVATFNSIYSRHAGQTLHFGPFPLDAINPGTLSFFTIDPDGLPNVASSIFSVISKNGNWPVMTTNQPVATGWSSLFNLTLTVNEVDTPGPCTIYISAGGNTSEGVDTFGWPFIELTYNVDVSAGPPLMCFEGTYDPSKLPLTLSFGQIDATNWLYSGVPNYWLCTLYAAGPVVNPNIPRPVEYPDNNGVYNITLTAADLVGVSGTFLIAIGGNRNATDGTWPGQVMILMEPSPATGLAPAPPPGGATVNVTPTSVTQISNAMGPQFQQVLNDLKAGMRDLLGNQMTNKPTWQRTT